MTDLFAQHRDMARSVAYGMAAKLPRSVAREDLEQAALIGLFKWCTAHPDDSHPGWRGGLITRMRGAILDWLRREDYLTRGERARGDLQVLHLEDVSSDDGPAWQDMLGQVQDPNEYARVDALRAIDAAMPARLRNLVVETFALGTSQAELACELGISEPRVNQLLVQAKDAMRAHLERQRDVLAPGSSVQVLASPKFRVRDFRRELWLTRRNELFQRLEPGMSLRALAIKLRLPDTTVHTWCTDNSGRTKFTGLSRRDPISTAMRRRGKVLIAEALRVTGGTGEKAAALLKMSNTAVCAWRKRFLPDAPTCPPGKKRRVDWATIAALYKRGLSTSEVAKAVGLSKPGVAHALRKLGVPGRQGRGGRRRRDISAADCHRLRSAGLPLHQIARQLRCGIGLVRARLKEVS